MKGPTVGEDVRNLGLIGAAGLAGMIGTVALLAGAAVDNWSVDVVREARVVVPIPVVIENPVDGTNRLYGTVRTVAGDQHTGFIRWDQNEGSWADLLDASKIGDRGSRLSGVRFGNIARIEPVNSRQAMVVLRDGSEVLMESGNTDLGSNLRSLDVLHPETGEASYQWRDIESVEFSAAPADVLAREGRLYGTLTSRDGASFTGYITWDMDEVFASDILDGDVGRESLEIPFGAIREIARNSARSARVVMIDGSEMILDGSNDVDASNRGISVSDPGLGQVVVEWNDFGSVRFHEASDEIGYEAFQPVRAIEGTVTLESGESLSGQIRWDRDEAANWELLNGHASGMEFQIEFGQIARIEKLGSGSRVELKDGRVFDLSGSNDVDADNSGIAVSVDGTERVISWRDFASLTVG